MKRWPLIPPTLYSRSALLAYATNGLSLGLNAVLGWRDRATDWPLMMNCGALSLSLCACAILVRRMRSHWRIYHEARRLAKEIEDASMKPQYFRLDGRRVVKCSMMEWAQWFEHAAIEERRVALDRVEEYEISTVFLGLDHSIFEGVSHIFETAVFDPSGEVDVMKRYATYEAAERGHGEVVDSMRVLERNGMEITRAMLAIVRGGMSSTTKKGK